MPKTSGFNVMGPAVKDCERTLSKTQVSVKLLNMGDGSAAGVMKFDDEPSGPSFTIVSFEGSCISDRQKKDAIAYAGSESLDVRALTLR
jgi:hypothetical protein